MCCGDFLMCITNSHDNYAITCALGCAASYCSIVTNCYCYTCVSAGCYCFYKNGAGVCQVALATFPNITICICAKDCCAVASNFFMKACYYDFCVLCDTSKIVTVPITYVTSVSTVYMDSFKCGSGTVVYNVYDANNTSTALSTSLTLGALHTVSSSCSHVYEIVQCNDAVSCIRSYAVAVGIL
jgi:hypothetical protein